MIQLTKTLLLIGSLLFSVNLLAGEDDGFGIEDDVENLFYEIEEENKVSEPQDEYSIQGERGAYSDDERLPNNLSHQENDEQFESVRKEFLDAGEDAVHIDNLAQDI